MRAYYLCSPAITSLALILLSLKQFADGLTTIWVPCTALPYFALYARDLRLLGYAWADLPRVYALNLMLLPINLTGVIRSIQQMLLSRRSTFGRTPKIEQRTPVPPIHVLWQIALVAFLVAAALLTFMEGRYYFTLCWAERMRLSASSVRVNSASGTMMFAATEAHSSIRGNYESGTILKDFPIRAM
jgi:cellulose synthase (UDP-forming)